MNGLRASCYMSDCVCVCVPRLSSELLCVPVFSFRLNWLHLSSTFLLCVPVKGKKKKKARQTYVLKRTRNFGSLFSNLVRFATKNGKKGKR